MRGRLAASVLALAAPLAAAGQAGPRYDARRLHDAAFLEQVHTDVTTQTGTAERERRVLRIARFGIVVRGDTMVVTADSLDLRETADGVERTIDVDAVIGGRWKLMLNGDGHATVLTRPFVPGDVGDVSDLAIAMDDFFPPAPSPATGKPPIGGLERSWHRRDDSAGVMRYHWSEQRHRDSSYVATDSVAVRAAVDTREDGDVAWDVARGPVAWNRRVETTATSRFAGRTTRAVVAQRIAVRRIR